MPIELLVHAPDLGAAEDELATTGGRLLHVLSDHLLVVTLPDEEGAASLASVSTELPADLDPDERILAEAWTSRFGVQSRSFERLERAAARPVVAWDDPGHTPPDHEPGEEGQVSFDAAGAEVSRSTGTPTSLRLTGSVAVGIVMVSGPQSLDLTAEEKAKLSAEVLEGLAFLASADPAAKVTFAYDWRFPVVTAKAGSGDDYEDFEAPWRNAALKTMGFAASRQGSIDYVKALKASKKADWAFVAYFTKYPLKHFAYAGGERLVMAYANDGWGPDAINQVFAHEVCHIFGAADEYGTCGCGGSGMSNTPNANCKNCTTAQIDCLMNGNTLSLCSWSRGQIGWSSWQRMPGWLKHVSVAGDGAVWGVNSADDIFRWNGSGWVQVAGKLKQISVGSSSAVWGVNSANSIFRRSGSGWTQVPGKLKHVSVAADGAVWGVNADDTIFRWNGSGWTKVSGSLKQISVGGASSIWGVNHQDEIYRWAGTKWSQVSGSLKHVSVAADGTVWGVNFENEVYRRNGDKWQQAPGSLKQVSTGGGTSIWGVNASDAVFRRW